MKQLTVWKADDGTLHEKKEQALEADVAYWKALGVKQLARENADKYESRNEPGYHLDRGGHM